MTPTVRSALLAALATALGCGERQFVVGEPVPGETSDADSGETDNDSGDANDDSNNEESGGETDTEQGDEGGDDDDPDKESADDSSQPSVSTTCEPQHLK